MKKLLGTALILLFTLFAGYSQQDNSNDDVYYNDNNNIQQPANNPAQDQNYDEDNGDNSGPTYQTFYDQLGPYGSWVNYPGYGYCWVPGGIGPDFSPYTTNGHWVYTEMGWTWVSDFAWGWGPFHYGRWFEDAYYGWMWVPGFDWAPAWVIWGDYNGYYGWACLGPRDILSPHFRPEPHHWHFIEHQYMGREDFGNHIAQNEIVAHNIGDINTHVNIISHANTYRQSVFFAGPKPAEVEHYSGQKVQPVTINNVSKPAPTKVTGNSVNIYRPNIVRSNTQPTPAKTNNSQDIKPANRPTQNQVPQNVQPKNNPVTPERQQPAQQWSPPRQNSRQNDYVPQQPQQQRQYNAPAQQPVQRNFVPTERPAPQQHYSAPQQQQHFQAPAQHYSAPPAIAPRGGAGRR